MKTKNLVLVLIIVLLSTAFFGCDAINAALDGAFLKATEVKAGDLASYTGTAISSSSSDDDVLMGFLGGMQMLSNVDPMSRALGSDYADLMYVLDLAVPGFAESRSVASRAGSVSYTASITDESIEGDFDITDYYTYGDDPGDITVTKAEVTAQADVDSLDPEKMEDVSAKVEADLELIFTDIIEYDTWTGTQWEDPIVKINEMRINANAKLEAEATIGSEGYPESVDFYVGMDLSIGFSLSADGYSGKYIVNLNYVDSGTVTEDDVMDGDVTGTAEDISVTIEVYNNSGTLIKSVTQSQDDMPSPSM